MTIDTRYNAAIRNALLEQMHDASSRIAPDGSRDSTTTASTGPGTDSISLSDDARRISAATDAGGIESAIDWQRIGALRHAIAGGTFSVDHEHIAEKLYRMDSELHGRQS